MPTSLIYGLCVLVWGTTWYALTFQVGALPIAVAVTWRFGAAALILLAIAKLRGEWRPLTGRAHLLIAVQGLLGFALAYGLTYWAARFLPSGLLALANGNALFLNIIFGALWFAQPIRPRVVVGALVGIGGMAAIFAPDLADFSLEGGPALGLFLVLLACMAQALSGQLAGVALRRDVPIVQNAALAMGWAALALAFVAFAIEGDVPSFPLDLPFVVSFLWLTILGSVLVFIGYYALIRRIGADRAAYAQVAYPVVALGVSTVLEGYHWTLWSLAGAALVAIGNIVALSKEGDRRRPVVTRLAER